MKNLRFKELNYNEVFENLVNGTAKYLAENNLKVMVLGISGGIDSTVTSAICHAVSQKTDIPLVGLSLPCSTNKEDENTSAMLACQEFCDEFKVVNLQEPFEVMEKFCQESSGCESTKISQGNIKARLRMITLYDVASKRNGIVIGTSNLSEWLTGFWTIHGDIGDLNPIGELWKCEVYGLARFLKENIYKDSKALEVAIEIIPTDGNGTSDSDADQIMPNYTYNEIDHVLNTWNNLSDKVKPIFAADGCTESIKDTVFGIEDEDVKRRRKEMCEKRGEEFVPNLGDLYGVDSVRKVCMRSWNSGFKRKNLEMCLNIENGEILMH